MEEIRMIDRFAKDKINFINAFKNKNSFYLVKEILMNGLDANAKIDIMQLRTQDEEKKLAVFNDEQLHAMGKTLLSVAAYQITNDDQKEIIQLLLLMGAKDTEQKAEKLLEKQRIDCLYELEKKGWNTLNLNLAFGKDWRGIVSKMITRIDEIIKMLNLQWSFDAEWKLENSIRENVITIFKNYMPRFKGMFSGKHSENILEAKQIINHLEKNPDISFTQLTDLLLNIGEPINPIGEFNRRLNYCFNKLGLEHKRLNMSLRLIITPPAVDETVVDLKTHTA
jgi:hypothetical protein